MYIFQVFEEVSGTLHQSVKDYVKEDLENLLAMVEEQAHVAEIGTYY